MSDTPEPKCAKFFCIPHRFILGMMTSLAIVNCYTLRVSLSTAVTEMILENNETYTPGPCSDKINDSSLITVSNEEKFNWTKEERGRILSSFYVGYILSHVPGGITADMFGAKHVLGFGVLITAVLTILTPPILYWTKGNSNVFIFMRFMEGLCEGPSYPAANVALGQWIPVRERGTWGSVVYAGSQFGTIFSNLISGNLIAYTQSWASVFYFFGGVAIIWWIVWILLCYNTPDHHPCLKNKEKAYLKEALGAEHMNFGRKPIPWIPILSNIPMWSLVCVQIGHDWGWYTMVTDLPKYMKHVLGFNVQANGIMSSIPYTIMWFVSLGAGFFCDWMIQRGIISLTNARKLFNTIGSVGPAVFLLAAGYGGCSKVYGVVMFTLALGTMGTFYCGLKVNALDLSPNYAGTLMAISNGIGSATGMITGYLTSVLTPENTFQQWQTVFIIAFCLLFFTNFAFLFLGSGDEQWWNNIPKVIEYCDKRKAAKEAMRQKKAAKKQEKEAAKQAKRQEEAAKKQEREAAKQAARAGQS